MPLPEQDMQRVADEILIGKKKGLNKRALMGRLRGRGLSEQEIKGVFQLVEQAEAKEELVDRIKNLKDKMEKKGVIEEQESVEEEALGELESLEVETLPIEEAPAGEIEIPEKVEEEIEEEKTVAWPTFVKKEKGPTAVPGFKPKVMEVYGAKPKPEEMIEEKVTAKPAPAAKRPAEEKPGFGEWLKGKLAPKKEEKVEKIEKPEFKPPEFRPEEVELPREEFKPVPAKPASAPKPTAKPVAKPKAVEKPAPKPIVSVVELRKHEAVQAAIEKAKEAVKEDLFEELEMPEVGKEKPLSLGDIIGRIAKPKPGKKKAVKALVKPGKELEQAIAIVRQAEKQGYSVDESISLLLAAGFSPAVATEIMKLALKK